jgi:hypothetical protein
MVSLWVVYTVPSPTIQVFTRGRIDTFLGCNLLFLNILRVRQDDESVDVVKEDDVVRCI